MFVAVQAVGFRFQLVVGLRIGGILPHGPFGFFIIREPGLWNRGSAAGGKEEEEDHRCVKSKSFFLHTIYFIYCFFMGQIVA